MDRSDGLDAGQRPWAGAWVRWVGMVLCVFVLSIAVAASALATFTLLTRGESERSDAVAKDRATAVSLDLDRYLTSCGPVLDATLASTIKAFGSSGAPKALDERITVATGASCSMIVWPYRVDSAPGDPSFDDAMVAGNTDAAVTELFQGDISGARGEPVSGVGDLIGTGPALFAGRPFRLRGKTGYVLISAPLGLKSLDGMSVKRLEEGTEAQLSLPRGAAQLDVGDLDMGSVDSVLYVPSETTPTIYANLQDWDGAGAGRIVLTSPPESPDRLRARAEGPYLLSMLVALAVGLVLGVPTVAGFAHGASSKRFEPTP